jgi:Helix-turn-helix domain
MTQGKRPGFSLAQKTDIWSRWKAAQSLHVNWARLREATYVDSLRVGASRWDCSGGSSALILTAAEREDISRGLASGSWRRDIARTLECVASTVSREVTRYGGRPEYRASTRMQSRGWQRWKEPFWQQAYTNLVKFIILLPEAFEAEVGDLANSLMVEPGIFANGVGVRMTQKRGDFADGMTSFH